MGMSFNRHRQRLEYGDQRHHCSYYQEEGFQYPIIVQMRKQNARPSAICSSLPISPSVVGGVKNDILLRQVAVPQPARGAE